ncbi:MAG: hypothetical protein RLZZ301_1825 [Bacteroidota bacterium]|jgi:pentose-5-phosphate-3-epimerase
MKISASIYSDPSRPLPEVIADLVAHEVELLHVDCNDDPTVFKDIATIRSLCNLPIDLHLITETPENYYALLEQHPVEYLTFQHESLNKPLQLPASIRAKKGIAVITPTPISIFEAYSDFDFILIMATIPGQSGGQFDRFNFEKIRHFRKQYPQKSIHVDGGVNAEVSFILRQMGVSTAVSGSYLFKASSIGNALMNLTKRSIGSHFRVADFMIPLSETPHFDLHKASVRDILLCVEHGNMGVAMAIDETGTLCGLVSSADIRKGLIKHLDQLSQLTSTDLMNPTPLTIQEDCSVTELLQVIKRSPFAVLYLPVTNAQNQLQGIVQFSNLIKAEL